MDNPVQVMTPTALLHDFETPLYGGRRVLLLDEASWLWLTGLMEAAGHTVQWVEEHYQGDAEWGMRTREALYALHLAVGQVMEPGLDWTLAVREAVLRLQRYEIIMRHIQAQSPCERPSYDAQGQAHPGCQVDPNRDRWCPTCLVSSVLPSAHTL